MNEMFLIKLKYFLSEEPNQFLVKGIKELSKLTGLLCTTDRYTLISIEKLGKIDDYSDLISDLIDGQKPQGLDCGSKIERKGDNTYGSQK